MLLIATVAFLFNPPSSVIPDRPYSVHIDCQRAHPAFGTVCDPRTGRLVTPGSSLSAPRKNLCADKKYGPEYTCDPETGKVRLLYPALNASISVPSFCKYVYLTPDARCDSLTGKITYLNQSKQDEALNYCNTHGRACIVLPDSNSTQNTNDEEREAQREAVLEAELDRRDESARRAAEAAAAEQEAKKARDEAANQERDARAKAEDEARTKAEDEARTKAADEARTKAADEAAQKNADSAGASASPAAQAPVSPAQQAYLNAQARLKVAEARLDDVQSQLKLAKTNYNTDSASANKQLWKADARLALVLATLPFTSVPAGFTTGTEELNTIEIRLDQHNPLVLYKSRYPGDLAPFNSHSPVALKYLDTGAAPESTLMLPELADALHVLAMRVRLHNPLWTLKIDETYVQGLKGPQDNSPFMQNEILAALGNRHPDGRSADVSIVSRGTVLNDPGTQSVLAGLAVSIGFNYVRNDSSSDPADSRVYLSIDWPARWITYRNARYNNEDTQRLLRARAGLPEGTFGKPPVVIRPPATPFPIQAPDRLNPGQVVPPRH